MKKIHVMSIVALLMALSSCQVVGDIFKAGVWVGILLVFIVVVVIVWLFSRGSK